MISLSDVKLIIWDLDDTLWQGVLSEGPVTLHTEVAQFINDTLDIGIVHSICSKNNFHEAEQKLSQLKLWPYFIFPSISWEAKGYRVRFIIESAGLRPKNVLFIDDHPSNLSEAQHFCPDLQTTLPTILPTLIAEARTLDKQDKNRDRLRQYKILEAKSTSRAAYDSAEQFLMSCDIQVTIHDESMAALDRIHDLLKRSNQLNYTKLRPTRAELEALISDASVAHGYAVAKDRFGDYGLIGFFAVRDNQLIHFAFSCRTLGMAVEQYVYAVLGYPEIQVIGDVAVGLSTDLPPRWINQSAATHETQAKLRRTGRMLMKGPCDIMQLQTFLGGDIDAEVTYINALGMQAEGHNHTAQIASSICASPRRKAEILADAAFFDSEMFHTQITSTDYSIVVLSMLTDAHLGVYRRKATGELVAFGEAAYDLTDTANHNGYVNGSLFTAGVRFTHDMLQDFAAKYEYVPNDDGKVTEESLGIIRGRMDSDALLILLLGVESEFLGRPSRKSYENRHVVHQKHNERIRGWASRNPRVRVLPFEKYVDSNEPPSDSINHFSRQVYYKLSQDLAAIASEMGAQATVRGWPGLVAQACLQVCRKTKIYRSLANSYRRVRLRR
jgi:FkbH-like protein